MSNSSLVTYTKLSPNCTKPRNHKIDTITIHHMAGNLTVETCGNVFAPTSRQASSNYGVGTDGRIGLYVNECDRSWCSSSSVNDNRAITIEVANDDAGVKNKTWTVSDKAMKSLIELCADICKRNGISKLVWSDSKTDRVNHKNGCNMTVHRDFAATGCPEAYLMSKMPYIAFEVNKKLGVVSTPTPTETAFTMLRKGSKGSSVKTLQANLNTVINANLDVDGDFGTKTETAVKNFQKKYNLDVDGIYGEKSNAKMTEVLKASTDAYKVRINVGLLNVRAGAGLQFKVNQTVKINEVFTIVETVNGWGKLKSGAGWILLECTVKV